MMSDRSNFTTIQITILDVNDNYPIFPLPQYNASINETTGRGVTILIVTADDADEVTKLHIYLCVRV